MSERRQSPKIQKASDQTLREAYAEFRNIKKVADVLGLHASSVHERLQKLGIPMPPSHMRPFTDADREKLRTVYIGYAETGTLDVLAEAMGRTKHLLCREARKLGLISQPNGRGRRKLFASVWKHLDEAQALIIWEQFKQSPDGLGIYCRRMKFDSLGFSKKMKEFFADEWDHVIELKAPKQSMYRLGRALEYRSRDHLRKLGYFVLRSPASQSPLDLVAIRKGEVVFIQCKRSGHLSPKEWNEFFTLSLSVGALPLLAEMHPRGHGVQYHKLLALKDGSKSRQPYEEFVPQMAVINQREMFDGKQ